MRPRVKKLLGLVLLLPALVLYAGVAVTLAERLPDQQLVRLLYFIAAGVAWAAPAMPFIRWMERDPHECKDRDRR